MYFNLYHLLALIIGSCFNAVSQFTLYGFLKGNKPDFHVAMPPEKAKPFYASLVEKFQKAYNPDAVKGYKALPDVSLCKTSHFCS